MLSTEEFEKYWIDWSTHEESNYTYSKNKSGIIIPKYLKKGYLHFDLRFWFPERKQEIKVILENKLRIFNKHHKREEWWAFNPFLKVLLKTPRYKYQQSEGHYDLETKIRPICFASHIDSLIYGFYSYILTRKYESYIESKGFSECVLAYRSNLDGKCNIQFAKEVFDEVKLRGECSAIALDIKGYFDNIDHRILKEKWSLILGTELPEDQYKIYKSLTQYSYITKNNILKKYNINLKKLKTIPQTLLDIVPGTQIFEKYKRLRTDRLIITNNKPDKTNGRQFGIPQGSPMSALLSNIYLIDFDKDLQHKAKAEGFLYRRYCDDILVVCQSDIAEELQKFIIDKIATEYFLEIQDKKVELTEFKKNSKEKLRAFNKKKQIKAGVKKTTPTNEQLYYKPLQYLGFEFNGQNIFIRSSSLSRYFRKMKSRIIKTVMMAYSSSGKDSKIWKKQIFDRYTHLGKRNFLRYAYNASQAEYLNSNKEIKVGLNSPSIKKQLSRHFDIILRTLDKKNTQRFLLKESKGKAKTKKSLK